MKNQIRRRMVLEYNDGRPGHSGVKARVLNVWDIAMEVQFEDRASTTIIYFHDNAWMDHLKIAA